MSDALPAGLPDWIREHIDLYRRDPDAGHLWDASAAGVQGKVPTLLLTTTGRKSGNARTTIKVGGVVFDPLAGHLVVAGEAVKMRNRELRLLELFLNAPGQIFSKSKLADRLFSYDEDVSENAIEVYIGRLRKHLSASEVKITTLRGLGYRLDLDG